MLNIVLVQPEIPQNTGNIGRTCVATGSKLHLVGPLGFSISDTAVKRAGLDYWPDLDLAVYKDWDEFYAINSKKKLYCFTTKGDHRHVDIKWPRDAWLLFGRETAGLSAEILSLGVKVRLPMKPEYRSFNLGNAVSVAVFECLRQWNFPGLI